MLKKIFVAASAAAFVFTSQPVSANNFKTTATYYSDYYAGRQMANGKIFRQSGLTAAHRSLKFGTRLRVTHKGKSVVVVVTDRCRCTLDLSKAAFKRLAPLSKGRIPVRVTKL